MVENEEENGGIAEAPFDDEKLERDLLRTEDVTLEGNVTVHLRADSRSASPSRDLFNEEALSEVANWGTSPMSPFRFMSPNRINLLGTPTKDPHIWSQLSPLKQNTWNEIFTSPGRTFLQSPGQRGPDLSPDKYYNTEIQIAGANPGNVDWPNSSPAKPPPAPSQPRSYTRKLQFSDFLAASAQSSKARPRDSLKRSLKESEVIVASGKSPEEQIMPGWVDDKRIRHSPTPKKAKTSPSKLQVQPEKVEAVLLNVNDVRNKDIRTPQTPSAVVRRCNCKKSECLKLYCDCFAAGSVCGPECKCQGCKNTEDNRDEIEAAVKSTLDRNPYAFHPKIQSRDEPSKVLGGSMVTVESHHRGCNCRRSGCQKKYCECFRAGVKCTIKCKCQNCENCDDDYHDRGPRNGENSVANAPPSMRSKLARKLDFENVSESPSSKFVHDGHIDIKGVRRKIQFLRSPGKSPGGGILRQSPAGPGFRDPL